MDRPANRSAAPAQCLVFAIFLALFAAGLPFLWRLDVADPQSLHQITGRVEQIYHFKGGPKVRPRIDIVVREGTGVVHHLMQDDPSFTVPAMQTILTGDSVVALAGSVALGRGEWLWGLKRGDEELLSYAQTFHIVSGGAERARPVAYGAAVLSALLLIWGIVLRKRFGAWRSVPGS